MDIYSVLDGELISVEQVEDPVFSERMLGDGIGILPASDELCSPIDGIITMIFPTKHAIGIKGVEGTELLIHIGIDTVELKGKPFTALAKIGARVSVEEPLMKVDFGLIRDKGYDVTTFVLVTNRKLRIKKKMGKIKVGDFILETI